LKIALIGGGMMASAIAEGLALDKKSAAHFCIYDRHPEKLEKISALWLERFTVSASLKDAIVEADVVVLLVKPKDLTQAISELKAFLPKSALLLSCAAGIEIATIEKAVGKPWPVARAMPNIAVRSKSGAAALYFGKSCVIPRDRERVQAIFGELGELFELQDEQEFHVATALLGSGPAFYLSFLESMAQSGAALGLDPKDARRFARVACVGAAALLQSSEEPEEIRARITSAKGTTMAGLEALQNAKLPHVVDLAIKAACERSKQLAQENL